MGTYRTLSRVRRKNPCPEPMNRTEHQLRMSFDPEYELKYERLLADRMMCRRAVLSSMKSKYLIMMAFWTGGFFYLLTKSLLVAFAAPVALWTLETLLYLWWEDRKKRKELGI